MTRIMTQGRARAAATLALVAVLAAGLGACGKYGPPEPYPPGYEAPDDEEEQG